MPVDKASTLVLGNLVQPLQRAHAEFPLNAGDSCG
jgi:hypothetical protein